MTLNTQGVPDVALKFKGVDKKDSLDVDSMGSNSLMLFTVTEAAGEYGERTAMVNLSRFHVRKLAAKLNEWLGATEGV